MRFLGGGWEGACHWGAQARVLPPPSSLSPTSSLPHPTHHPCSGSSNCGWHITSDPPASNTSACASSVQQQAAAWAGSSSRCGVGIGVWIGVQRMQRMQQARMSQGGSTLGRLAGRVESDALFSLASAGSCSSVRRHELTWEQLLGLTSSPFASHTRPLPTAPLHGSSTPPEMDASVSTTRPLRCAQRGVGCPPRQSRQ